MNSTPPRRIVSGPEHQTVICRSNETLLDAWQREGIAAQFSCKGGSCHTCILRCVSGELPQRAQQGVPEHLAAKGYFLPCLCQPNSPLQIAPVVSDDFITHCVIESQQRTPQGWLLLSVEPMTSYAAKPGQYTCLHIDGDWISPWRIHNRQEEDFYLHLVLAPSDEASWAPALGKLQPNTNIQLRPARAQAEREMQPLNTATPTAFTDPDLWATLGHGQQVREILEDFYTRVYDDSLLAPFFANVTKERVTGKQYSFLHDEMTGGHAYFGDNMLNVHHWMVISEAVFDHRQQLMETVLREHALTESQVARWMYFEERHRHDIVKDAPQQRLFGEHPMPLDGYQEEVLSCGAVCDHCGVVVEAGETVLYHLRLGTISCPNCRTSASQMQVHP